MSETPHEWGAEHFCTTDTRELYYSTSGPKMLTERGFPVELSKNPEPPTFCSRCLKWFDDPQHLTAVDHLPPEQGDTHA